MNNQIMDKQQKLFAEITAMRESGKIVRFLEDGFVFNNKIRKDK